MNEELGAFSTCAAYIAKSPLYKSWLIKNFFATFTVHIITGIILYKCSRYLIRNYLEPHFVANDALVGELADKYNFTIEDFSQTIEENHLNFEERSFFKGYSDRN
jgi:hypothetical protein